LSKEHRCFLNWAAWAAAEQRKEKLIKNSINLMLKACGLLVYNYFSMWKINCLEKAKLAEMRHQRALNDVIESIGRKRRHNLRSAFNAIAKDNWNTNMRQRILNKLSYVAFGKLKAFFDRWKYQAHEGLRNAMEAKKAKVIDMIHWHSLSDIHRAFLRWAKNMRDLKLRQAKQREGARQLSHSLTKARRRPVKSAMKHQKKKGTKTRAALRKIGLFYSKAPKEAFDQWRRWIGGDKSKFAKEM
jgi:hypothetical protein